MWSPELNQTTPVLSDWTAIRHAVFWPFRKWFLCTVVFCSLSNTSSGLQITKRQRTPANTSWLGRWLKIDGLSVNFSPQWTIHQFCIVVNDKLQKWQPQVHPYKSGGFTQASSEPGRNPSMHSAYLSLVTEELTLKDLLKAPECRVVFSVVLFARRLSDWIFSIIVPHSLGVWGWENQPEP